MGAAGRSAVRSRLRSLVEGWRRAPGRSSLHGVALFIALLLFPYGDTSGRSTATDEPGAESLAGRLLVSTPTMRDPTFATTVIYLIAHEPQGAMGLVVNRRAREVTFAELFKVLGVEPGEAAGKIAVYSGGPVEPERGFLLHSPDVMLKDSTALPSGVAMTNDPAMLQAIAAGKGPAQHLFAFGYAGWGAKQLETEIARGDWFTMPADPALIFAEDPDRTWERAQERRPTTL